MMINNTGWFIEITIDNKRIYLFNGIFSEPPYKKHNIVSRLVRKFTTCDDRYIIDVIEVLVYAMHSGRLPYRWDFNIMDICVIHDCSASENSV